MLVAPGLNELDSALNPPAWRTNHLRMSISRHQQNERLLILSVVMTVLVACTGIKAPLPEETNTIGPANVPTETPLLPSPVLLTKILSSNEFMPLTKAAIASCPITMPNGSTPPYEEPSSLYHGNGDLWTIIFNWGKTWVSPRFVNADGSITTKWGWWRGVRGKLTVEGRRLDAPAPPAQGFYDTPGYGDEGFQSGGILFPSEGCWEITGRVDDASLTFVTLVIKVSFEPIEPKWLPEGLISTNHDASNLPESLREIFSYANDAELIMESAVDEQAIIIPDPNATQQKVTVWEQPGVCVQGSLVDQQWQDNVDAGFLQWTFEGSSYRISHKGLGLRCDDLMSMIDMPP